MKPEHWLTLANVILTAIGLYVGPKLAVRRSLEQFRSQKWWERQGDTYNQILETLGTVKHCVSQTLECERHDYMIEPSKLLIEQSVAAVARLVQIAAVGPYYISEEASKALDKFVIDWSTDGGLAPSDEYERHLKTINESLDVIRSEARKHLSM